MIVGRGSGDYTIKYRPCTVDEVVGQEIAKDIIRRALNKNSIAPAYLFHGESGTGKTTMARILALGMNCLSQEDPTPTPCMECRNCKLIYNQTTPEYVEVNVGDKTGVDSARDLISDLIYGTLDLKRRVIVLDECQQMTSQAQNVLLKPVEDAIQDTHFIFCTTEPRKIIKPLRGRCKPVDFKQIPRNYLLDLLEYICQFEGLSYTKENLRLITSDNPSPRDAVSFLQQIVTADKLEDTDWIKRYLDQLTEEEEAQIIELARLMNKGFWKMVVPKLNQLKDNFTAEAIRLALAGYFSACLTKAKSEDEAEKFANKLGWLKKPIYTNKPYLELIYAVYCATKNKKHIP
jgi:DNA polymerase-3 subunit gamma/tau